MSRIDTDALPEGVVTFLTGPSVLTDEVAAAERAQAASLEAGHEEVLVKDAGSTYAAGRRGAAWRGARSSRCGPTTSGSRAGA
jgi:hypothetical protein